MSFFCKTFCKPTIFSMTISSRFRKKRYIGVEKINYQPFTGVEKWGCGLQLESHSITRMRFSTWDTSGFGFFAFFGPFFVRSGENWSSSFNEDDVDRERIFCDAALDRPERSETDPDGTNDGGFELTTKVPPKIFKLKNMRFSIILLKIVKWIT